jgi:glycosyltransferase involved in cell wall biosynthesis
MKLLFVTAQWDPRDIDSGSGVEYQVYAALKDRIDEIRVAGPFDRQLTFFEKVIRKVDNLLFKKRLIKFYPSYFKHSNRIVQELIKDFQPDVIFSKVSIPLVNVDIPVPLVYMCDSTVKWVKDNWPHFSKIGFAIMERWERKVLKKAAHIITYSEANAKVLINYYHKPENQVTVHPIPAAFPRELSKYQEKTLSDGDVVNLLLVGKDYHIKGVDIAIEATRILNEQGIPSKLRVVGQDGVDSETVRYMGLYSKRDPEELNAYIENYKWAHFNIFPSRFDAAGIVPSEAAAFGLPTITNNAGGLGTTVENGVSGIVLEKHSQPQAYAEVVKHYLHSPDEYQSLRKSTYNRYQDRLNWDVFGQRIFDIIQDSLSK